MSWDLRHTTAKWNSPARSIEIELAPRTAMPWMRILDPSSRVLLNLNVTPTERQGKHSSHQVPFGEAYVRQCDLIASYPEHAPCPYGYQIDVRVLSESPSNAVVLEFWLSIQTSLLDSHPQLELRWSGAHFRPAAENYWTDEASELGLIVHPLDREDCRMDGRLDALTMNVFGRFMEKGVIRRMRFRLIAAQRADSEAFWMERFTEFSESPLPLTT